MPEVCGIVGIPEVCESCGNAIVMLPGWKQVHILEGHILFFFFFFGGDYQEYVVLVRIVGSVRYDSRSDLIDRGCLWYVEVF